MPALPVWNKEKSACSWTEIRQSHPVYPYFIFPLLMHLLDFSKCPPATEMSYVRFPAGTSQASPLRSMHRKGQQSDMTSTAEVSAHLTDHFEKVKVLTLFLKGEACHFFIATIAYTSLRIHEKVNRRLIFPGKRKHCDSIKTLLCLFENLDQLNTAR